MLYDISYANMVLYGAVLPSYESKGKDNANGRTGKKQAAIRVDDKKNYGKVMKIFQSFD